ncbi:MAG: DNA topoisomerase [Verrucomicrobiaceae bacterium]|jgi:topoisomerase-4 subunit A|nr:DNA topoisomerase [Verrucomicrobiaceae bacterium]
MSDKGTEHGSLGEMYSDYFLDYASYVIMERAVPHLGDGLKPVQRRILHAMRQMEDGRYNKVANIVGDTMKYHPHGNVAIEDALVGMGQKDLLIDTQGNWGNVLTGDPSAAGRYIEARLTPFAMEVAFNPKTTEWTRSYDGRNREPVTLPMKFPLLLAQGGEGIAVGLACKILPHNFNELIEQCIRALRKKKVEIVPDFPTGGLMDASEYNDGLRGGRVRVRAKIEVVKKSLLRIVEIPWGTTTTSLQASIVAAQEKGKIKISRIEDNTAEEADILIHLSSGSDPESVRDALFAFTDCEISISPNSCVIADGKPQFLGVSEILRRSALQTKELLKRELEIRLGELEEKWHFSSLEKIFIEKRIYRDIEECETWDSVLAAIEKGLKPYKKRFRRAVTREDIVRLTEIRIKRISKYDSFRANEEIKGLEDGIEETGRNLRNLTRYAVRYYQDLQKKYGEGREPRTDDAEFERVDRTQVVAATETLYVDEKNGFAGLGLKREKALEKCSRLDDVIAISQDAKMRVVKISDKAFVGKRPVHVAVFRRSEEKIYSMIYREGRDGPVLAKRFRAGGVTRDKIYELGKDTPGTRVIYFAVHDTEDESASNAVVIHLKPVLRLRNISREFQFGEISVKGRGARGNILTKHVVDRVVKAPKGS